MESNRQLPLTIVVGSGRCGSTMLTQILHMHPKVLSLNEFWNLLYDDEGGIPVQTWNGAEFWHVISRPSFYSDSLVRAGLQAEEYVYGDGRGRFNPADGIPSICRFLASLTDDPDAVYDKLATVVPAWPRQPLAEHCRALFSELAAIFQRPAIVERTGGTLRHFPALQRLFPEARFVFLYRNGPDSVLSMSRHGSFRLNAMSAMAAMPDSPAELKELVSPPFDRERFLAYPIPLSYFGQFWNAATCSAVRTLRKMPRDRWTILRYENLLKDSKQELTKLSSFIGISAERQWLDEVVRFVDSGRPGTAATRLHPSDLAELRAICSMGTREFDSLEAEYAGTSP